MLSPVLSGLNVLINCKMVKACIMNLQSVYNLMAAKYSTNNCTVNTKIQATGNRQRFRFHELPALSHDEQTDRQIADALIGFCLRVRFDHT